MILLKIYVIILAIICSRYCFTVTKGERYCWETQQHIIMINVYKYIMGQVNILMLFAVLISSSNSIFDKVISGIAGFFILVYMSCILSIMHDDTKILIRPAAVLQFASIIFIIAMLIINYFIL